MQLYQDKVSMGSVGSATELAERIEADVAGGHLAGGDRLPPVRDMAGAVSLSPNTVATAYRRLADRGVVVSRGRAGTFVLDRAPIGVHDAPVVPAGTIDLASGDPDIALLPDLAPHFPHTGPSTLYTDPPILPSLVEVGSTWMESQGIAPDRLAVTSGALDAIERVLIAHLRPGDAVAIERPGWSAVSELLRGLGMRVVGVDIDDRGILPDRLAAVLSSVHAVVVTPRAQNPTGAALDTGRRDELAAVLDVRQDLLVIEDDHAGPVSGAELFPLGHGRRRWAFVQSMAKMLGPDLRLALLTGDDLTIDRVSGRFGIGPGWVSRILQHAVASLLSDRDVRHLLETAEESYRGRRQALISSLHDSGLTATTGRSGLNVWVPVSSEQAAMAAAADAGFALRAGSPFDAPRPAVRVTISNLDGTATARLAAALTGPTSRASRVV
jgi:DNA-binding transcriptional MocR family regulator